MLKNSEKHAPHSPAPQNDVHPLEGSFIRRPRKTRLRSISDIRRFFHRNQMPYYFISATNFNLLNIDEWVRNFRFINHIDCFDGRHPHVLVPPELPHEPFESIEDINNYLLQHKEVVDFIRRRGPGGKAVFLFFDEKTESLCREMGLELCFPSAALRREVDDKINATRLCNRAGVRSVPNVLAKVDSYKTLRKVSRKLGDKLVVQTSFGDSGHTTFFISNERDFDKHAAEIVREPEVKIMKRIRCRGSAMEACVTRHGTIAGPLMTELVGFPELTPYKGGWCGNEVFAGSFTRSIRKRAHNAAIKVGDQLAEMGYRGYFEIDFLTDLDSGKVYLGEINPRITGASSMTNLAAFAHSDAPLFLFHLLEWSDVDFDIDVDELNARWSDPDNIDSWAQLVMKCTTDDLQIITGAPQSGVWRMRPDGEVDFAYVQTHRRTVESENEAFFLRIAGVGDYFYKGADIGILITPGRLMDDDHNITARARKWIAGIRKHYETRPVTPAQAPAAAQAVEVAGFKLL